MSDFRVYGFFTVGGLELEPGPEREARIVELEKILREGLSRCTTIESFRVGRQMRPWNASRHDGQPEPDLAEEVTIRGADREAVFTAYKNDPGHAEMVQKLHALGWATWQAVVCQIEE